MQEKTLENCECWEAGTCKNCRDKITSVEVVFHKEGEKKLEELFEEYHQERLNNEHDYPYTREPKDIIKDITSKIEEKAREEGRKEGRDENAANAYIAGYEAGKKLGVTQYKEELLSKLPKKATFDNMDTTVLETRGEVRAWNECLSEVKKIIKS